MLEHIIIHGAQAAPLTLLRCRSAPSQRLSPSPQPPSERCSVPSPSSPTVGPATAGRSGDRQPPSPPIRTSDVFVAPVGGHEPGVDHPAMFPLALAERLIETFSVEWD